MAGLTWHRPSGEEDLIRWLASERPTVPPLVTGAEPPDGPGPDARLADRAAAGGEVPPVLSTAGLSGVREYRPADLTITVGAGTRVPTLLEALAREDQWLPLGARGLRRSAGGLVAAAPSVPYAVSRGSLRRHLLACRAVSYDGRARRWGRPVVKNVAGYDLPRLHCGSFARLGVLTELTFRVWPRPEATRRFRLAGSGPDAGGFPDPSVGSFTRVAAGRDFRPDGDAWTWAGGRGAGRTVVELSGTPTSVDEREGRLRDWAEEAGCECRLLDPPEGGAREAPLDRVGRDPRGTPRTAEAPAPPSGRPRPTVLRLEVGPRRLPEAVRLAREKGPQGETRLAAHCRAGVLRVHLPWREGDPGPARSVLEAARELGDVPVKVVRAPEAVHRAAGRGPEDRVGDLEDRVAGALGGAARHWLADYL